MGNQSVLLCLSAAGRLSALERVRSERFHCKSMKLGTWFLDILRSILRNGATSDLTFGDL